MYVSFYILAMISFAISLLGLLKAHRFNKEQVQLGSLSYRTNSSCLVDERFECYRRRKTISPKKIIGRLINRHLLIGLALFGFLLSLTALALSFSRVQPNEDLIDNSFRELVNQRFTYHIQDAIKVQDIDNVLVSVTKLQCKELLFGENDSPGAKESNSDMSFLVSISLLDPIDGNFVVQSLTQQDRIVGGDKNYIWRWTVKPIRSGKNDILLRLTIKMSNGSDNIQKDICLVKTIIVSA